MTKRCEWPGSDPLYIQYHDEEWGVPEHNDRKLFELLVLEGAQAGLSWLTILRKRGGYREAFQGFDPVVIARFGSADVERLMGNPSIVRNRLKIESTIQNAQRVLSVQQDYGSFSRYIWQFVEGRPIQNHWKSLREVPAETPESRQMSRDLLKKGFRFVGPTICYAFMQAVGMVNDHVIDCFRHSACRDLAAKNLH